MKSLLGLCILGIIGTCGGDTNQQQKQPTVIDFSKQSLSALIGNMGPRKTLSGDYLSGRFAQNHYDWPRAEDHFSNVLRYDADNIALQKSAMLLAMGAGETGRATSLARKVLDREPENALALLFLITDSFAQQDYTQATQIAERIPTGSVATFLKPILQGWAAAGLSGAEQDPALATLSPVHAYHALLIADYQGALKNVHAYLPGLLQDDSIDLYEIDRIADILARHNQQDEARKLYQLILTEQPSNNAIRSKIAFLDNAKKENEPSPPSILQSPVQTPADGVAEAFFDMARVLFRENSDDSAILFSRMVLALNPKHTEARIVLAHILARHNRLDEAIALSRSIGPSDGVYTEAQRRIAYYLNQARRQGEAVSLLESQYAENKDINALIMIGDIYREDDNFKKALSFYNRAVDTLGDDLNAQYWGLLFARGMTYERLGKYHESEQDLLKALEYRPNQAFLLNYLGYSWADQGRNLDRALTMIQQAVALEPEDGYIADSLGWVYFRMERYADAIEHLERAAELLPYDPVINDHLGDAYWVAGRTIEAEFQWTRALNNAEEEPLKQTLQAKLEHGLTTDAAPVQAVKNDQNSGFFPSF